MTPSSMGSSASIYSASPSVDSDASGEGNQSQQDRLKYITQAQALSGVQLVSILPYGKVASDIAEFIGMKTGLMMRSGKMKEDAGKVLHVVRKEVTSSLDVQEGEKSVPALMLGSSKAAAAQYGGFTTMIGVLKEQFQGQKFNVLDCVDLSAAKGSEKEGPGVHAFPLSARFVELFGVENFKTLFMGGDKNKHAQPMKDAYTKKFGGLFEEQKVAEKPGVPVEMAELAHVMLFSGVPTKELLDSHLVDSRKFVAESG